MNHKLVLVLLLLVSFTSCQTAADDKVDQMPGWPSKVNFDMYSGMLNAVDNGERQLHYMLLTSQGSVSTDPLVIWLNGGPGCSSLLGMIQENGPYMFEGINTEFSPYNAQTWNQNANVLYIEGPPGVGFSINNTKGYKYTDDNTAQDFLAAFNVFRSRFSSVLNLNNPLYISGESYAGMYIPFFTKAIIDWNSQNAQDKINITGILIGNGAFAFKKIELSKYRIEEYVQNNFFNEENFQKSESCLDSLFSEDCAEFTEVMGNVANNTDVYNIYNYTYSYPYGPLGSSESQAEFLLNKIKYQEDLSEEQIQEKLYQFDTFQNNNIYIKGDDSRTPQPKDIIKDYFNQEDVKAALHVSSSTKWSMCNMAINLRYKSATDSTHLYPEFFEAGIKVLIFSGNIDAAVSWQYTEDNLQDLMTNYGVKFTPQGKWRQWNPISTQQVGGMVQYYQTSSNSQFIFAMVRAAGHEVPMYQPIAAYHMFNNFINDQPI